MPYPISEQLHLNTTKKNTPEEQEAQGKIVEQRLEQCKHELTTLKVAIQLFKVS